MDSPSESTADASSDSTSDADADSEAIAASEDIDDFESPDGRKYEAPEVVMKYINEVVEEINEIVKRNPSKKPRRRSSIGKNSINVRKSQSISEEQKKIAEDILKNKVSRKIQLGSQKFKFFDMFIIVPYFHSLGKLF